MCLFLVLFWCAAVTRAVLLHNSRDSRFGIFNSRLGGNKFPFSRQRELPGKGLIGLTIPGANTVHFERNRKNSRFDGNSREFAPPGAANCLIARRPRLPPRWRSALVISPSGITQ
jgi:hypothetical protein